MYDCELECVVLTFQGHKVNLKCNYLRDLLDHFTAFWGCVHENLCRGHDLIKTSNFWLLEIHSEYLHTKLIVCLWSLPPVTWHDPNFDWSDSRESLGHDLGHSLVVHMAVFMFYLVIWGHMTSLTNHWYCFNQVIGGNMCPFNFLIFTINGANINQVSKLM